jgi:xanthine/uracil permease
MTAVAVVLLVVGHAVAVPLLVRLRSSLRERRLDRLLALEVATAAVATGWALRGAPLGVVLNVGFVAAFAAAWWWTRPAAVRV